MRTIALFLLVALLCLVQNVYSTGVMIKNAQTGTCFQLHSSIVEVNVSNQVAMVVSTQTFTNNTGVISAAKYGFPLPAEASATGLRYKLGGVWHNAVFEAEAQDTVLPGGGGSGGGQTTNASILAYLGETPLYFNISDSIPVDSTVTIELTYVQLLNYQYNKVDFYFPSDYSLIQSTIIPGIQSFSFSLESARTIVDIVSPSHTEMDLAYTSNTGNAGYATWESASTENYFIQYELASNELGMFDFSTYIPDTLINCDGHGKGFFAMIIEPESNEDTEVIQKNFTLIVDKSGSMNGSKIGQARDAASFIVNHLNLGDYFNIISFNGSVSTFATQHVEFNAQTQQMALGYISQISAGGSTNISGALTTAISQFAAAQSNAANIIIFFTDGEATAGVTSTSGILDAVSNQVNSSETQINLYTFGIGSSTNEQLLSLLAVENNGLAAFLGNDELDDKITEFYLTIQNPVLLNSQVGFSPNIVSEVYPMPLPNLYKGIQLILVGRYSSPGPVTITLNGTAFGNPVSYSYTTTLTDHMIEENHFLPKLWAKKKIDDMTTEFYTLQSGSTAANSVQTEITDVSMCYEVMSIFTSFTQEIPDNPLDTSGGGYSVGIEEMEWSASEKELLTIKCAPNPFSDNTSLQFHVDENIHDNVVLNIFDTYGRLIRTIEIRIDGRGDYTIYWDGLDNLGQVLPAGHYFFRVNLGNSVLKGMANKV